MNYRNAVVNQKQGVLPQKDSQTDSQKDSQKEEVIQIMWNKKNMQTMLSAQKHFNELITQPSYTITASTKRKIRALQRDIDEYYTSTCNVCGDKQSNSTHMNIEHVNIKVSWGYESDYDGETHQLVLCCQCYTQHIMKSTLGQFVHRKDYM